MTLLKPVLRVRELPPSLAKLRQHLPSITELVSDQPQPDELHLLDYLQQGISCGLTLDRGIMYDLLDGKKIVLSMHPLIQPAVNFTDGIWIWSGAIVYYVMRYHVRLDAGFVAHARDKGWKIDGSQINVKDLDTSALYQVTETQNMSSSTLPN